jgi:hypothetical protein
MIILVSSYRGVSTILSSFVAVYWDGTRTSSTALERFDIPFIDVGTGVEVVDDQYSTNIHAWPILEQ